MHPTDVVCPSRLCYCSAAIMHGGYAVQDIPVYTPRAADGGPARGCRAFKADLADTQACRSPYPPPPPPRARARAHPATLVSQN